MRRIIILCMTAGALAGCHKPHSVAWYQSHPKQLSQVLQRCGRNNNSTRCNRAAEAKAKNIAAAPAVTFNGEND